MILAPTLSLNTPARGYDADATAFAAASGATDVAALSAFVKGVKELGLWNSMVCWPLRSSQNAGTGTTAYSLGGLGTFNGTLRGGLSWGADGVVFDGSDDRITTPHTVSNSPKMTLWAVGSSAATTGALIAAVETFEFEGFYISIRKTAAGRYQYRTQTTASGSAENLLGTNTAISGFASVGCGVQGSSTVAVVNGISDGSGAYVPNRTGTGPVTIGGQVVTSTNGVTLPYTGTIAFAMSFVGSADGLTTSQQLALHNLYRATLGTGLGLPDYDPATIEYANRSGATDLANIDAFVRGVKALGLWNSMVCWPLRSSQNAGTGTTAYSLGGLGTFDGTLTNGPTWGVDGLVVSVDTERMTTTFTPTATSAAMGIALKLAATGSNNDRLWSSDQRGTEQGLGMDVFDPFNGNTFRRLSSSLSNFGLTSTNWTFLAIGGGSETFLAQDASRTTSPAANLVTPHNILQLGNPQEGARPATYAFAWWINGALSAAGYSAFRALYKSTLGTGLGLP